MFLVLCWWFGRGVILFVVVGAGGGVVGRGAVEDWRRCVVVVVAE